MTKTLIAPSRSHPHVYLKNTGDSGVPTWNFDPVTATFTAKMGIRYAPKPFAGAVIVQGDPNNAEALTDDVLSISRGTQISGNFYPNFDGTQGTVTLWWTPEYSYDQLNGSGRHFIWNFSNSYRFAYEYNNDRYILTIGGQTMYVSSNIAAGTSYLITVRWDCNNTLDGTNYVCLSIGDTHTFGISTQPTASATGATIYIGSDGSTLAGSAVIEGLTVYRRPLYDGSYGINVGNGDEINLIYNSGTGRDPCRITGSWDVCFCLPTNYNASGELANAATMHSWSHPHSSGVLTDQFCQTTYGSSAWSTKGTPSSAPQDIASAANKVFNWGYEWTADADAEGVQQTKSSLTAGKNYVVRCIAHENEGSNIRLRIYDNTNSADIVSFLFGASSTRAAPGVAIITFELPTTARHGVGANCTSIIVSVEATSADQIIRLHQIELIENRIDNPSFEGTYDEELTGIYVAPGWNQGNLDVGVDVAYKETTIVHSGSGAQRLAVDNGGEYIDTTWTSLQYRYFTSGCWLYVPTGFGTLCACNPNGHDSYAKVQDGQQIENTITTYDQWVHKVRVHLNIQTWSSGCWLQGQGSASYPAIYDDCYSFYLDTVSLTVTAASKTNSTESTGLRVDGGDICYNDVTGMGASSGCVKFKYTPRHSPATYPAWTANYHHIFRLAYDGNNEITCEEQNTANLIRLNVTCNGVGGYSYWDCTGQLVAGTTYNFRMEYDASGAYLYVDDVKKVQRLQAISFPADKIPNRLYVGCSSTNSMFMGDGTFAAP